MKNCRVCGARCFDEAAKCFVCGEAFEDRFSGPNTEIWYLYRDASNYKRHNRQVVSGQITETKVADIISCLDDGEYFIPEQVGLPADRLDEYERDSDDHCWLELAAEDFSGTFEKPTVDLDINELVANFRAAKGRWEAF